VNDRPSHQRWRLDFVGAVTRTAHHNILGREELTGYPPIYQIVFSLSDADPSHPWGGETIGWYHLIGQ
jgi:hypothetical protein